MMHLEKLMHVEAMPLAEGDRGVAQTIEAMRRLIDQGKKDPRIHELAARIVRRAGVPPAFHPAGDIRVIRAIGLWVQANITYLRDVVGKETLHGAAEVVELGIGDCDDFTILICSLLETLGIRTHIVTISSHNLDPSQFTHVFPEARSGSRWIPVDFARKNAAFAKGPEHWARRREWSTGSEEYEDVSGLNGYGGRPTSITARPISGDSPAGPLELGYNPNALPGAYRADTLPRLRRTKKTPPLGMGHYGLRALGVLSQDQNFDWSTLAPAISAATTGTANIIAAERAAPTNLFPTTSTAGAAMPLSTAQYSTTAPGTLLGIPTSTLLLLLAGAAVVFVGMGKR